MTPTYLVSAHIIDMLDRQIGTAMIDVQWPGAPSSRDHANALMQEICEANWASGELPRSQRYKVSGWSEYAS